MPIRQEVIQNFLEIPGIAGVALLDGISCPFFHGFTPGFNFPQQQSLAQSIQQVLETTPEGFNSFEFQFDRYRVCLHKLNQGGTLLVLSGNELPRSQYMQSVRRLLLELQIGQENPIAAFRSIAIPPSDFSPSAPSAQAVSVKEILLAMNALSQLTTQYLGTMVVANYWQTTCPDEAWLQHFQIERSAQITYTVQIPSERLPLLTEAQHQSICTWVAAFLERCSQVIRNFPKIVQHGLDDRQKFLLLNLSR